ncbi:MAG: hypothetical protein NTW27_15205 [Deltaproteobacteria bacterium]|nr:hypothetical protein [Deltaproteobacteria bacterium]
MTSTSSEVTYQDVQGRIDQFMTKFKIATLLNLSGIRKVRGNRPACMVRTVFQLAFVGRNIYTGVHTSGTALMGKDAVYRLLSSPRSNWRVLCNFRAQLVREIIECTMKEALRLIKPRFHAKCES